MVSRMHSEIRRLCQNKRFPTVQGFTTQECIPVGCITSTAVAVSPAKHTPLPCHACPPPRTPLLPCTPPATHASPAMHAPAMHAPCHATPLPRTPPVNRITDRCKNITFPQLLLRTVKIAFYVCQICQMYLS